MDAAVDGSTAGSDVDTIVFDASLTSGGDATIQQTVFDTALHSGEFGPSAFIIGSDVTITGPSGDNGITINSTVLRGFDCSTFRAPEVFLWRICR